MNKDVIKSIDEKLFKITINNLFENLPGHVYWKDTNFVYQGCNKEQAIDAGLNSREEIVGKTDYDMPWHDQAHYLRTIDERVIKEQKPIFGEEPSKVAGSKEVKTFYSKKVPIFDENGKVVGILGISMDITELKKLEEELKKTTEEKIRALGIRKDIIRNFNHDLRTQLNILIGGIQLFKVDPKDKENEEALHYIAYGAAILLDYVNQAIEVADIMENGPELRSKKFDLLDLLKKSIELQMIAKLTNNITFTKSYDLDIPATVIGDKYALEKILMSILGNAVKFAKRNVPGHIKLYVKKVKDIDSKHVLLRFEVCDDGIGIAENQLKQVFTLFFKAKLSNKTGSYEGQGAGLYVTKALVDGLGGNIEIVSKEGEGTIVRFDLPFEIPLDKDCLEWDPNRIRN